MCGIKNGNKYDLIILNGRLVDPKSHTDKIANIGIKNGKITAITSNNINLESNNVIDASGLIVSPGFIDMHCHEDYESLLSSNANKLSMSSSKIIYGIPILVMESRARDGVTTMVGGNCGLSYFPLSEYFLKLRKEGCIINYAAFSGHSMLREQLGTFRHNSVSSSSQKELNKLIINDLEAGALGVSFGIMYSPGTTFKEILSISKLVADYGKIVATHARFWGNTLLTLKGLQEFINIADETGITLEYSHIGGTAGYGEWMDKCLKEIDNARKKGIKVYTDIYPYYAGMGFLGSCAFNEDVFKLRDTTPYDYEVVSDIVLDGKTIMLKGDRFTDELFRVVRSSVLEGKIPDPGCIAHGIREEKVKMAMLKPYTVIASDALVGFDCNGKEIGHPRASGTYSRFFGRFVRDEKIMDLMTAIKKCSTLPAEILGLNSKGHISIGADADITIFNYDKIMDKSTYGLGFRIPPEGIEHLIVNGVHILKEGILKPNVRAGKVLNNFS